MESRNRGINPEKQSSPTEQLSHLEQEERSPMRVMPTGGSINRISYYTEEKLESMSKSARKINTIMNSRKY